METQWIAAIGAGAAAAGVIAVLLVRGQSRPNLPAQSDVDKTGGSNADSERPEASHCYPPIRNALSRLLSRSNADAFVVFSAAGRKKIVQFAGGADGLLLDLPVESLSESERARAESYFGAIDVRLLERPNFSSFQIEFGHDIDEAARTTLEVYERVYALAPGFRLSIEEN